VTERTRIPLHRDPKFRALVIQILALTFVVYGFYSLFQTTVDNLVARGIQTGTSFFDEVAPFQIGFSPFFDYKLGESTYIDVFFVGIQNTILVAVLGIIAATLLGFLIGVARLSPNWLISRGALVYIEIFRNVPLLLQIMFWNFAIFLSSLPAPKNSIEIGVFYLNARGFHTPMPLVEDSIGFTLWMAMLALLCVGLIYFPGEPKFDLRKRDSSYQSPGSLLVQSLVVVMCCISLPVHH
jgi:general L-amino acid transport system permease protein